LVDKTVAILFQPFEE